MKNQEVRTILAVSVLSVGLALSACGNKEDTPVESPVVVEQVSDNTISDNIEEDLVSSNIAIDGNLDASVNGIFYAQSDTSIFKKSNQASDILAPLVKGDTVEVKGIYGQTGMYQIIFEGGVAYVDSSLFDVNKETIDSESANELTDAEKQDALKEGITSDTTVTLTDEQLQAIVEEATKGTGEVSIPAGIGDVGDGTQAEVGSIDWGNGDYSGSTTGEVTLD